MKTTRKNQPQTAKTDPTETRHQVLEKLKAATTGKIQPPRPDFAGSFYHTSPLPPVELFCKNLEEVKGVARRVKNEEELLGALQTLIASRGWKTLACPESELRKKLSRLKPETVSDLPAHAEVAITGCEYLVAGLGAAVVSSAQAGSRQLFVFPPVHLILARQSQLVETLDEAYQLLIGKYGNNLPSLITTITGPSRTADIEKTLILGAHGPQELYVFISETNF